jgi:hypothetical protein
MPEMIVKQDAVRSQATLKKVEEEIDTKSSGGNKQQSYARNEQVKAQVKKQAEEADLRKKLQANEKKVATLEKSKQALEKKAASQKNDQNKAETPAEKLREEQADKKTKAAQKGEVAAKANDEKQEKVQAAKVPDKETVKQAKEKTEEAEREQEAEEAIEVKADQREEEEEKDPAAKPQAKEIAHAKGKAKPDATSTQLKAVKTNLQKAYGEQLSLTRQLVAVLTGLAGLETNLEKRRKLQAEAKGKLHDQIIKLEQKQNVLKRT